MKAWRLITTWGADPAFNMGLDEALLESAEGPPTLRFYSWRPDTLSLGYFQRFADVPGTEKAGAVVRRITGGGAIHHVRELTFSIAASLEHPLYRGPIADSYVRVHEAIRAALAEVGLGVEFSISARAARIAAEPCDVWLTTWLADYPDPDGFFRGLLTDPCDPLVDEEMTRELVDLMNQARASRDQDERLALYGRVDRLLVAEWVAVVPLAYSRTALLRRPWVHGLWANALTPFRLDGVIVDRESAQPPDAAG